MSWSCPGAAGLQTPCESLAKCLLLDIPNDNEEALDIYSAAHWFPARLIRRVSNVLQDVLFTLTHRRRWALQRTQKVNPRSLDERMQHNERAQDTLQDSIRKPCMFNPNRDQINPKIPEKVSTTDAT